MSNSSLINYTRISPNKNSPRNHKIDTITIHCYVGQASVESAGDWFSKQSTQASCNYMIGSDGRIALIVDENDRSWCSSNAANDHRAVTIECACDKTAPYAINSKVYASLINLCADICKRNGIKELKWKGDKSLIGQVDKQNMTVHRWFKNKDCPGEYIYSRLGQIAAEVNAKIGSGSTSTPNVSASKKINEDGQWGVATTTRAQEVFGTPVDGKVSNQHSCYKNENPGLMSSSWEWSDDPSDAGSALIKAIQKKVGSKQDGKIGPNTIRAMQKWLGTPQDGVVSNPSSMVKAFQKWLNNQ